MRLDEYVDGLDRDESVELRKLAEEKSYAITDHIESARTRFDETLTDGAVVGSTAPSMFVGRSSYPNVSTDSVSSNRLRAASMWSVTA